jgi:integrase
VTRQNDREPDTSSGSVPSEPAARERAETNRYQMSKLFETARTESQDSHVFRTRILTIAMTVIRHAEALALQWDEVDFKEGKILIRRTWPDKWRDEEPIFYV